MGSCVSLLCWLGMGGLVLDANAWDLSATSPLPGGIAPGQRIVAPRASLGPGLPSTPLTSDVTPPEDEAALVYGAYRSRLLNPEAIRAHAESRLSDIRASELSAYRLEGIVPQGPKRRGPWSSFDWVFTRPDGVLLVLSEWDFVADGGGVLALREDMNMSVRGHPARFQLRSTPSGKRVSELSWASRHKLYSLKVWDEVGPDARQTYNSAWLLRLAEQIR